MKNLVKIALSTFMLCNMLFLFTSFNVQAASEKTYIVKYKEENGMKNYKKRFKYLKNVVTMELSSEDVSRLKLDPNVEYIEEDEIVHTNSIDSSTDLVPQNLVQVHVPQVHTEGIFGSGVKVAVLDTGINIASKDLKIPSGVSFVPGESDFNDLNGHGTAASSIIASQKNGQGLLGISPNVELYAVKVLDKKGNGTYSQVIEGLEWAIDNKIDIVNLSLGGTSYSSALEEAIRLANNNNILLVAASGNSSANNIDYPAKFQEVIAVGAVDNDNNVATFSNTGKELALVAPGVNVDVLGLNDEIIQASGTSFSVPHVVGIAALIKGERPEYTNAEIRTALIKNAEKLGQKKSYGNGLVNPLFLLDNK